MADRDENRGRFGEFGGRYVSETLWTPLEQVAEAYRRARDDEEFQRRQRRWRRMRVGRPTPLTGLSVLSRQVGGARLWAKREDLCHSGTFCISSALTQALVADRMDKTRLIGETATGDFGIALGSVGAALGMEVTVYMGREAIEEQPLNAARMRRMGVELVPVDSGGRGRSGAMAEALRNWAVVWEDAFYATSSLASPAPLPQMVGRGLAVIGEECYRQLDDLEIAPEYVIAPLGSGSFAAGLFAAFVNKSGSQIVGVQAGGDEDSSRDAASLVRGRPGVFQGTRSLVLQNEEGQIEAPHASAAGMMMSVAGPQHARWLQNGAVHYATVDDQEARQAQQKLLRTEGILANRETGYALAYALKLAPTLRDDQHIVFGITGSGIRTLGDDAGWDDTEES